MSAGCQRCYAETFAARNLPGMRSPSTGEPFAVQTSAGPRWTGKVELIPALLDEPMRWRKAQRVFVNSMSDLFHESLPFADVAKVFERMAWGVRLSCRKVACQCDCEHDFESYEPDGCRCWSEVTQHTYQILTKRPARMREFFEWLDSPGPGEYSQGERYAPTLMQSRDAAVWPLPNVWLGVSVEDQATADERIPVLLETPAAVRFVSYEPALAGIDFDDRRDWLTPRTTRHVCMSVTGALRNKSFDHLSGDDGRTLTRAEAEANLLALEAKGVKVIPAGDCVDFDDQAGCRGHRKPGLDLVIVGGESGPGARPFDVEWARSTVRQCQAAGVPVFVKQLGARPGAYDPAHQWFDGVDFHQGGLARVQLQDRKGGDPAEWPEDLRVREFPQGAA